MASFCGDCGGKPRRQAGWWRRDCLSPDQMGGRPGVALTQSSTITCSIHLEGRNRKTLAKGGSAQGCGATCLDRACLGWVMYGRPATSVTCPFYPQYLPRCRRAAIGSFVPRLLWPPFRELAKVM